MDRFASDNWPTMVGLWQLVNAYRTLANQGRYSPLSITPISVPQFEQRLDGDASFIINNILSDRTARGLTFGFESALATSYWTAVKTGTSKDMRDNWCIGFSDRFTVGVWTGNFDGSPMRDVSGVSGAAPVWIEVMNYLHRDRPSMPPQMPPSVVARSVKFASALESDRQEWFLHGTELREVRLPEKTASRLAHITYPGRGEILAIDPDIPPGNQRVFFEVMSYGARYGVRLDGSPLDDPLAGWQPTPGRHRLQLLDEQGRVIDEGDFEVRGMSAS